jgi:hypothetical protein
VPWPEDGDWIRERLPRVVEDAALGAEIGEALQAYEALRIEEADRVLVHGDVGLHNLAVDPATLTVRGIFDYDGSAWADGHHDFRYLLFDVDRPEMLEGALSVYEPAVRRERVELTGAKLCELLLRKALNLSCDIFEEPGPIRPEIDRIAARGQKPYGTAP